MTHSLISLSFVRAYGERVKQTGGTIWVDRVVDGLRRKNGPAGFRVVNENKKNKKYDVVIDDVSNSKEVIIRKQENKEERLQHTDLDWKTARILWLALSRVGKSFTYKEIQDLWGSSIDEFNLPKLAREAREKLDKILGSRLTEKLLADERITKSYRITMDINYCWMRRRESYDDSILLYGQPSRLASLQSNKKGD